MPVLILKALECTTTEDLTHADSCRLEISVDGDTPVKIRKDVNTGERWVLNRSHTFQNWVRIKLYDEDSPDPDDFLGDVVIGPQLRHRERGTFKEDDADYTLWYEVIPENVHPATAHQITEFSLRAMFGRMGRGVLSERQHEELVGKKSIYRCSEFISLRDAFAFHAQQDGGRGNTNSVRVWVNRHCNPWGEESVIPISSTPRAFRWHEIAGGEPNWVPIRGEKSYCVAGFQHFTRCTETDNPLSHETRDWLWDQVLDPSFTYMLNYTAKRKELSDGLEFPYIHNEQESGSIPVQWRTFWGEYVTTWGRHIFDVGHMPVTPEMHAIHAIVCEHTTAGSLGDGGAMVPVNRATIGMGFSGGFPGDVGSRWNDEFGSKPDAIWGDTTDCWATNLKRHPLKFRLFPPVPRPSDNAVLRSRIVLCEYIQVPDWGKVDDFLELCQYDDPADGGEELAFRVWDRGSNLPRGFKPKTAPAALRPTFTLRHGAYFDVTVDLTPATQIPVGYYAIVECGWSEKGAHTLYEFDVTFEKVKAVETDETWDDWHMYYGVNGQWAAWWTDDFIDEGETYTKNTTFRVWTVDTIPLSIRDCGVEWDGTDFDNEKLDRVEITAPGPDHFDQILAHSGVELISRSADTLRIKAKGWEMEPGDTRHEWTIKIVRRRVL